MIKKLLFISAFIFVCSNSYSQEHQISAGYGVGSSNQILDVFENIISTIFVPNASLNETSSMGEFRLAYAYTPKEKWHFGVAFSYSQTDYDVANNGAKIGEQTNSYYTMAAETSYSYLKKEKLNLYSLLGAGATVAKSEQSQNSTNTSEDSTDTIFNFQVTPFGISYGKQWGGFAEVGFGYRGILSFGAFYNFN